MSDMYTGLYFVPVNPDDSSAGVRLVVPMPIVKAESLGDQVIGVDNTCELFAALRTFFETRGNQDRSNREGVATKTMLVQSLKTLQEDLGGFQVLVGLSGHASDDSVFSQLKRQADVYLAVLQDEDFSYDSGYVSGTSPVGSLLHGHGMVLNVELPDSVKKIKPKSGSFDAVKKGIGKELVKVLEDVVVVPNPSKRSLKEDDRRNKEQLLQSALKGAEKQLLADLEGYDTNKFSHTAKLIVLIEYYLSDFLSNLSRTPHAIGSYKKIQELVIKPFVSSLLSISLLKMPNEIKAELWIEKVMADIVCEDGSIRPAKVENISVIDSRLLEYEEAIKKSTPVKLPRSGKAEAVSSDQEEDACSASIELDDLIFCMQQTLWCKEEVFEDNRYRFLEFAYAQERSKAIGADMHGQYNVLMTKSANHLSLWVQFFFACLNQYVLAHQPPRSDTIACDHPLNMADRLVDLLPILAETMRASSKQGPEAVVEALFHFVQNHHRRLGLHELLPETHIDAVREGFLHKAMHVFGHPYHDEFMVCDMGDFNHLFLFMRSENGLSGTVSVDVIQYNQMRKQKECAEDSLIEALTPRQKKELSRDIAGVLSKSDQDLDQGFAEAVSDGRINIMDLEQRARDFLFKRLTKIENIDGYFKSLSPASVDVILRAAIESEMAPAPVILGLMGALEQMQGPSFLLSQGETSHCQLIVHAFAYPSDQSVIQLWLELLSKTHSNDIPIELLLNAIDHQSEEVVLSLIEVFQAKGLLNAFEKLQMTQMISKAALLGMSKVVWALEEAMPGVLKKRQGYGETLLSEVLSVDRCESLSIELIEYYRLNAPGFLMNPFASIASLTTLHFAFTTGASEAVLLALIKAQHSIDPLSVVSAIKLDSDASRGYLGAPLHLALSREAPRAVSLALLDCYQEDGAKFLIFNKNDGISLLECAMKHCTDSEVMLAVLQHFEKLDPKDMPENILDLAVHQSDVVLQRLFAILQEIKPEMLALEGDDLWGMLTAWPSSFVASLLAFKPELAMKKTSLTMDEIGSSRCKTLFDVLVDEKKKDATVALLNQVRDMASDSVSQALLDTLMKRGENQSYLQYMASRHILGQEIICALIEVIAKHRPEHFSVRLGPEGQNQSLLDVMIDFSLATPRYHERAFHVSRVAILLDVIKAMAEVQPEALALRYSDDQKLPLHRMLEVDGGLGCDAIIALIEGYKAHHPELLSETDVDGNTALHLVVRGCNDWRGYVTTESDALLNAVIEVCPELLWQTNNAGRTPAQALLMRGSLNAAGTQMLRRLLNNGMTKANALSLLQDQNKININKLIRIESPIQALCEALGSKDKGKDALIDSTIALLAIVIILAYVVGMAGLLSMLVPVGIAFAGLVVLGLIIGLVLRHIEHKGLISKANLNNALDQINWETDFGPVANGLAADDVHGGEINPVEAEVDAEGDPYEDGHDWGGVEAGGLTAEGVGHEGPDAPEDQDITDGLGDGAYSPSLFRAVVDDTAEERVEEQINAERIHYTEAGAGENEVPPEDGNTFVR